MKVIFPLTVSVHVFTFVVFAWAIARLFRRDRQLPARMQFLTMLGSASSIALLSFMTIVPSNLISIWFAAFAIYLLSLGLFAWSCFTTWKNRLPIAFSGHKPAGVQQRGPYAFVRHPFYVSYGLAYIAGAMASNHLAAWCVSTTMLLIYWRLAINEERELLNQPIGDEYAQYIKRTGRFVPSIIAVMRRANLNTGDVHV